MRRWPLDFAWPEHRIAVELHGGVRKIGRHQRPDGFINDCQKRNALELLGWRLLEFTDVCLRKNPAGCIEQLQELLGQVPPLAA